MLRPLLIAAVCFAASCTSVNAAPLVDLAVVDRDSGQWLPDLRNRGERWIAGTPGHRYGVRLTNTSGERVLVVLSVDGVNAVTGQTATPSQGGYVLEPWESAEIAGWRKSLDDVAQFVFTDLPDSYAARTGRPYNVGVIGIAVFRERQLRPVHAPLPVPHSPPIASQSGARERATGHAGKSAPAATVDQAMAQSAPQRLGTGHGQREWAPVGQTEFTRASSRPQQVSQVRYDDADALVALGILPRYPAPYARNAPRAFPNGFVQDPPYNH